MRLINSEELKQIVIGVWNDIDRYVEGDISLSDIIGIIDDMPTIEPEPHWIPCSERLPEGKKEVLVTEYGDTDIGRRFEGRWLDRYGDKMKDVTAWMPRPEPYKGDKE